MEIAALASSSVLSARISLARFVSFPTPIRRPSDSRWVSPRSSRHLIHQNGERLLLYREAILLALECAPVCPGSQKNANFTRRLQSKSDMKRQKTSEATMSWFESMRGSHLIDNGLRRAGRINDFLTCHFPTTSSVNPSSLVATFAANGACASRLKMNPWLNLTGLWMSFFGGSGSN